jgi:hypothetical protein
VEATLDCQQCGTRASEDLDVEQLRELQIEGAVLLSCRRCASAQQFSYARFDRRGGRERRRGVRHRAATPPLAAVSTSVAASDDPLAHIDRSLFLDRRDDERRNEQQRRHRRVPLRVPVRLTAHSHEFAFSEQAVTLNVSGGGVYFHLDRHVPENLPVSLELGEAGLLLGGSTARHGVVVRVEQLPVTGRRGVAIKLN